MTRGTLKFRAEYFPGSTRYQVRLLTLLYMYNVYIYIYIYGRALYSGAISYTAPCRVMLYVKHDVVILSIHAMRIDIIYM